MANYITLTEGSITVAGASKALDLTRAILVELYDELDVDIWVQSLTNAPQIDLLTSMQNQFDDIGAANSSWVPLMTTLAPINTGHFIIHLPQAITQHMLRYVRWSVTAAAADAITFTVTGMARRKSF